ncbi:MAG TPA: LuxR C-terminal-related transcriptional regulator [Propionicimonas sp.]|jgi:DNA-binding CsgD family transcriptional regulator
MREWAPALTLWSVVDEPRFAMTLRCLGVVADWARFFVASTAAGLVDPGPRPDTLVFRPEWAAPLEAGLDGIGGREALRARLVDSWSPEQDPYVVADIAVWARDLGRWDMVEEAWIRLNVHSELQTKELLALFRDLPIEARLARPVLTWSASAAASALAAVGQPGAEALPTRLMLDSAMLHANWSTREDTDTAVYAGTFRMLGERRQPSSRPGQALQAAWRTKEEVEAFIDARSREGRGPDRRTQALFRVMSAQIALFRAVPLDAIGEARWAAILADVEQVRVLARGVEALALSFSMGDAPAPQVVPVDRITDPLGVRGMRGLGEAYSLLAQGNQALRRLDREAVEHSLAQIPPEDAAFAGVWAVRAALGGFRDGLWGDLGDGMQRLSAEVAHRSRVTREQDETLGAAVLGRARMLLLTKSGAFGAATASIEHLPEGLRLLPQARIHLWAGQFDLAIRVADAGAYDEGRGFVDRHLLLIVKAAASLLARRGDADLRAAAIKEMRHLLATQNFVPIAVLPKPARDAMIELCAPELGQEPNFAEMLEKLAGLNDSGERGVRPLRLTERELVLLPMLATEVTVPEIARQLQVSVNTVRKQVVTLREKFGSDSRAELIRKARAYGAIP